MKFCKRIINDVFSLIFPNHCIICGELMQSDAMNYICINCINKNLDYIHKDEYARYEEFRRIAESKNGRGYIQFFVFRHKLHRKNLFVDVIIRHLRKNILHAVWPQSVFARRVYIFSVIYKTSGHSKYPLVFGAVSGI